MLVGDGDKTRWCPYPCSQVTYIRIETGTDLPMQAGAKTVTLTILYMGKWMAYRQ